MKNTGKIWFGLAASFVAGTIVGTLWAPEKGERTRRQIRRRGEKFYDDVSDTVSSGKEALEDIKDRLIDRLQAVNDELVRCK